MAGNRLWSPYLKGGRLPPLVCLEESISGNSQPTEDRHPGWTRAAFSEWVQTNVADDALWDTVLTLWRLCFDVNRDAEESLWVRYVLAYLVISPAARQYCPLNICPTFTASPPPPL
jgi:hypothetical protein